MTIERRRRGAFDRHPRASAEVSPGRGPLDARDRHRPRPLADPGRGRRMGPRRPTTRRGSSARLIRSLHLQRDGEAVLALLVGQAGPHHFSASVRVMLSGRHGPRFGPDARRPGSSSTSRTAAGRRSSLRVQLPRSASRPVARPADSDAIRRARHSRSRDVLVWKTRRRRASTRSRSGGSSTEHRTGVAASSASASIGLAVRR